MKIDLKKPIPWRKLMAEFAGHRVSGGRPRQEVTDRIAWKDAVRRPFLLLLLTVPVLCVMPDPAKSVEAKPILPVPTHLRPLFSVMVAPASGVKTPQSASGSDSQQAGSAQDVLPLPEGKGKDTTKRVCGKCHSTNVFAQQRHTSKQWSSIIDNMVSKGMEASDDDLDEILDYLAANFPLVPKKDVPVPSTPEQH